MKKRLFIGLIFIISSLIVLVIAKNTYKEGTFSRFVLGITSIEPELDETPTVNLRIALVSDIESDLETLEVLIGQINNKEFDSIFVLGDITTLGTEEDMRNISDTLSLSKVPVHLVPGDRDLWKSKLVNFNKVFNDDYYLKEIEGSIFMFINNADEYDGISEEQFTFIRDNISKADYILLHNPIYFEGSLLSSFFHKGMGQYSTEVDSQRKDLLQLVRQNNVKAVFAGDLHLFTEQVDSEDKDLRYYTIGALNNNRSIDAPSYAILEIYSNGEYKAFKEYVER